MLLVLSVEFVSAISNILYTVASLQDYFINFVGRAIVEVCKINIATVCVCVCAWCGSSEDIQNLCLYIGRRLNVV